MDERLQQIADYLSACGGWRDVDPAVIAPALLPRIFVLGIEHGHAASAIRLRIRLAGTSLDAFFGRSLSGRYLDEFVHGPRGADVLTGFARCAESRAPIWMRQVVAIRNQLPRYVEGVAFFMAPDRICGGLAIGELTREPAVADSSTFEIMLLEKR